MFDDAETFRAFFGEPARCRAEFGSAAGRPAAGDALIARSLLRIGSALRLPFTRIQAWNRGRHGDV